jgi:hypothetical protein
MCFISFLAVEPGTLQLGKQYHVRLINKEY